MPYKTAHVCQLRKPGTLRIVGYHEFNHEGKKYRALFGMPRAGDEAVSVEYEYQYPAENWMATEARAHCSAHDGIAFHKATDEKVEVAAEKLKRAVKK